MPCIVICERGFFFFNDTATTEIYTLSLHDALPICCGRRWCGRSGRSIPGGAPAPLPRCWCPGHPRDRKSTRLNSSHANISYAVFCLKKKKLEPLAHTVSRVRRPAPDAV